MTRNSPASDWSVVWILASDWLIFVMGLEIQCSVHLVYAHAINVSFILGTIKTFHHSNILNTLNRRQARFTQYFTEKLVKSINLRGSQFSRS